MVNFRSSVLVLLLIWLFNIENVFATEKQIIGWLEYAQIKNSDLQLKAKIDTGATTSSLNANIIKTFTRDKEKWIRFSITNKGEQTVILERKVQRYVNIKRKLALSLKRPVINLGICVGKVFQIQEVNLADRKNFEYQMLIGRNYLHGYFLVDSELEYTTKPSCK